MLLSWETMITVLVCVCSSTSTHGSENYRVLRDVFIVRCDEGVSFVSALNLPPLFAVTTVCVCDGERHRERSLQVTRLVGIHRERERGTGGRSLFA
jgi:hypothetical protein